MCINGYKGDHCEEGRSRIVSRMEHFELLIQYKKFDFESNCYVLFSVEITVIESCDDTYNKITQEISYSQTNNSNVTLYNCSWRITVPDDRNVILDIINLQIEPSDNCENSSLEFFDGSDDRSAIIGEKMCGLQTGRIIESSGNELYLKYSSTASLIHDDQFSIKFNISGKSA